MGPWHGLEQQSSVVEAILSRFLFLCRLYILVPMGLISLCFVLHAPISIILTFFACPFLSKITLMRMFFGIHIRVIEV